MLHYPKIPSSRNCPGGRCVAFEKYDGTNLHWDWDRECGWHSFGTRRDSFVLSSGGIEQFAQRHVHLQDAVELFQRQLVFGLERVFRDHAAHSIIDGFKVFTEFVGPNSFAGLHKVDDPKQLILFDVEAEGFGLIGPDSFVGDFAHLPSARVVYRGKFTGSFCEAVRTGKYDVNEGVICKGGAGGTDLWMAKIKTNVYMQKLKAAFADRWEQYWE